MAELDWLAEPALRDRPRVGIVKADPPGGSRRGDPGDALPGLVGDLPGGLEQVGQVVHGPGEASPPAAATASFCPTAARSAAFFRATPQGSFGVGEHPPGLAGGDLGQAGQFGVLAADHGHRLVAALGAAGAELRVQVMGATSGRP